METMGGGMHLRESFDTLCNLIHQSSQFFGFGVEHSLHNLFIVQENASKHGV